MIIRLFYLKVIIIFLLLGCSENIVTECDTGTGQNGGSDLAKFGEIQKRIFDVNCATSGCHTGASPAVGLDLSPGNSYGNLVNVNSILNPSFKRVLPGDSQNSFLIKVLRNSGDGSSQMPPSGKLSDAAIDSIAVWIDSGALNN